MWDKIISSLYFIQLPPRFHEYFYFDNLPKVIIGAY